MILNTLLLEEGKTLHLSEDLDFSGEEYTSNLIKSIKSCHVEIDATDYGNLIRVVINLKADIICPCAYTLEDVPLTIKTNEEFDFTDDEEFMDDDELIFTNETKIDLKPYIYSVIVTNRPMKVIKKGASRPESGNGYRILTEEEFKKEKETKTDSRWSKLDDLDL